MSDFTSGLREQLVAAAAREQARRLPHPGPLSPATLAAAIAAAVLATLVGVAALGGLRGDPAPERSRPSGEPALPGRALFSGPLEAGVRYRTRVFSPVLSFLVRDDAWFLRRPLSVDLLELERTRRVGRPATQFLSFARVTEVFDPSVPDLRTSRIPAPPDLHGWLARHPDLRVGRAGPVAVGDVPGEAFNVDVRFTRPAHADTRCRSLGLGVCTRVSLIGSYPDGMRMRMLVLETEPQPLTIAMSGRTAADLAEVETAAAPVLTSLLIGTR
jgi:hypothetical protein